MKDERTSGMLDRKIILRDEVSMSFLRSLRAERLKRGYTLSDVGNILGIGTRSCSKYEYGTGTPQLGILIKLAEIFEYDISESINYKYYYGEISLENIRERIIKSGLTLAEVRKQSGFEHFLIPSYSDSISLEHLSAVLEILDEAEKTTAKKHHKIKKEKHADKFIYPDEITVSFLSTSRELRLKKKLSAKNLARMLGVSRSTIYHYEHGIRFPELPTLIKLAEIFEYDISESINYKYYHGEISRADIKKQLLSYGITYAELSQMIGYGVGTIKNTLMSGTKESMLECLNAILEVLKDEEKLQKMREELLKQKKPVRREWWKKSKAPKMHNSATRQLWQWPF